MLANHNTIPSDLKAFPHWVCYAPNKIPYDAKTGQPAKANDPVTWSDFQVAAQYASQYNLGVGFQFGTVNQWAGIVGVDIDHCREFETGNLSELAIDVISIFSGCYTEISPSGTGLHILFSGKLPDNARHKIKELGLEVYDRDRYFTITGNLLPGASCVIRPAQSELDIFYQKYFPQPEPTIERTKRPQCTMNLSDADLISKILKSKQGAEFQSLWNGDTSRYNGDDSAADIALSNMLAFWCRRDPAMMDNLFRQSGLYREKWDRRTGNTTYGAMTIQRAVKDCRNVFGDNVIEFKAAPHGAGADQAQDKSEPKFFNRTDAGNAEMLADACGDKIRFCFEYNRWLIYDGKRWEIDTANHIYEFAKKTARTAHSLFKGDTDAQKYYRTCESKSKMAATVFLTQSLLPISPAELDSDNWLLNVQNGVLDLRTGRLLPHDPRYFMTKICKVGYFPNVPGGLWQESLEKIIPNKKIRDFVQRFAGYSLTGSTREEKFVVLNGEGGTGKGTVTETLADVLGDYADTLSTDVLLQSRNATSGNEPTPEIAKLTGVRLLLASETGQGRMLDEAKVKALTGGDRIPCRKLRCDPFTFQPNFKLWLSTNHVPRVRGTDEGVWRRISLVPFDQQFKTGENRDNTVKERLHDTENLQAVLSWAVAGCLEWQRIGINEPDEVIKLTNDYRNDCDVLERFFADECVIGPKNEAPVKVFYRAFKEWCLDNGHLPGSSSTFASMMELKHYSKVKRNFGYIWAGIKLVNYDQML